VSAHAHARRFARRAGWLGLLVLAAIWLGIATPGNTRVQPYYVVKGVGTESLRPRVLFVLDTSGSMAFQAQASSEQCVWNECEGTGTTTQSRISTARNAIAQVVGAMSDQATFALMTFQQYQAPTSVPAHCNSGERFAWTTLYGYFTWAELEQNTGYDGAWRLCDDANRPYPYLRWDDLGVGSVISADDQTDTIPDSPLIATDYDSRSSSSNATRKVQWFPRFMGVRANLDDTTDPDGSILAATIGDWASTSAERDANVKGHDFYYWPYVDGFPGYAAFVGSPTETWQVYPKLGVVQSTAVQQAGLYAPFYLDLDASVPEADRGPSSLAAGNAAVLTGVSPLIEGGVDAEGISPWASVIGSTNVVPPESNAIYSHSTVASYLEYVSSVSTSDACAPTIAVLVTDGQPDDGEGGATLHERLADLRNELGVKTYVVGMFSDEPEVHAMACAAAGACSGACESPCTDTPASSWDTCADANSPSTGCAWLASSGEQLAKVLGTIVSSTVAVDVASGPGERMQEFGVGADGTPGEGAIVQTSINAYTEWPSWRGHVVRELCDDVDASDPSQPASWCVDQDFTAGELEETFGPCPQSRSWDAGECLRQTDWNDRRIYSHESDGTLFRISESDGTASAELKAELVALGLMTASEADANGDSFAAFVLGRDFSGGWKLPGLADSAPVVVRRVPKLQSSFTPSVAIRDPHCAGRRLSEVDASGLPDSLESFAKSAWDDPGREYQEAVVVGDDLGVLHAFQLDSGNELFGIVPRVVLASTVAQWHEGSAAMGQPIALANHHYGVAATLNHGWAYDASASKWRHLGIIGLGVGGTELLAFDLSHMSPSSPEGPLEILWTTEDAPLKASYDAWAGQTWARPALVYEVPNNVLGVEPTSRLVIGTGYPSAGAGSDVGRTLIYADAITGTVLDHAVLPAAPTSYDSTFGTLVDPAIASHCISRYWGEVQEAYIADPAGRLFRWDLGNAHEADSGDTWGNAATPALSFESCEGSGSTCTVGAGGKGDPFLFPPAVSASGRIDPPGGAASGELPDGIDQFLVALASGSPADDTLGTTVSSFHSSLYLLVDDHSQDHHEGFDVPSGGPKVDPSALGTYPHYARIAVSDLERTRTFTPYPGASTYDDTGKFARGTRPIRAPRIEVRGVVDSASVGSAQGLQVIDGVEVYTITYTLYEPPSGTCDERFYDSANQKWYSDEGATYEVTLRLTGVVGSGFDFANGASDGPASFDSGYAAGLVLESVQQVERESCSDGNCGPTLAAPAMQPCDGNTASAASGGGSSGFAIPLGAQQIPGFTPIE
jgi:hypothetical protein